MLGAGIDVQCTEPREAGAAAHRPKAAQVNRRGLGGLWGRGCTNRRQQVSQRTIAPDPRVIAALDDIWRKEVWPAFTAHFGIA